MSEPFTFRGPGLVPGGYAGIACGGLDRATVELLLASWFAWLGDRAAVTLAPAGAPQAAELRIRRWKTRPGLVLFRWRNADETRESFVRVRESFEAEREALEIELTPKTKKPRAMVIALDAADVFAPAAAVGLANRAFAAAGFPACERYDLTCTGVVLEKGTRPCPLVPQGRAFKAGRPAGGFAGRGLRWVQRALQWGREGD